MRREFAGILASFSLLSCGAAGDASSEAEPDWELFRSTASKGGTQRGNDGYQPQAARFVFSDLQNESDRSLARRLLGAVGERIVFIDRHRDRWQYYDGNDDPIHNLTLYSAPESWGSAFGICRTEKYEVSFSDEGQIESVSVSPHYGVEGPIFQKSNFDWDYFRGEMCEKVPANHMPSYFPAEGVLEAQDLAILLGKASFLAGQPEPLSYDLSCKTYRGEQCAPGSRQFLSELRFDEIGETSRINCGYAKGPAQHCFTVKIGEHRLGPWPKQITIKGSTYKNNWEVFEVSIRESFTIS